LWLPYLAWRLNWPAPDLTDSWGAFDVLLQVTVMSVQRPLSPCSMNNRSGINHKWQRAQLLQFLKADKNFSVLSQPHELEALLDGFQMVQPRKGDVVLQAGVVADAYFLLTKGSCDQLSSGGVNKHSIKLSPGTGIGWQSLLTDRPVNCTVVAGEDTVLWKLPSNQFVQAAKPLDARVNFEDKLNTSDSSSSADTPSETQNPSPPFKIKRLGRDTTPCSGCIVLQEKLEELTTAKSTFSPYGHRLGLVPTMQSSHARVCQLETQLSLAHSALAAKTGVRPSLRWKQTDSSNTKFSARDSQDTTASSSSRLAGLSDSERASLAEAQLALLEEQRGMYEKAAAEQMRQAALLVSMHEASVKLAETALRRERAKVADTARELALARLQISQLQRQSSTLNQDGQLHGDVSPEVVAAVDAPLPSAKWPGVMSTAATSA